MHKVFYKNKLEHKCTIIPLDPRLLYVRPIQAKEYLDFRYSCLDSYKYKGYLPVPCVPYLAACSDSRYPSV